jgi:transcription elongation factor GreB
VSVPNYISPVGFERLTRELEWLKRVERPRVVSEVSYAASLGDRSENAEYIYGKKRLREIDGRLHFLMGRLANVQVVDPATQSGEKILFGATVTVTDEHGVERTWRLLGEDEVNTENRILSWKSPMGRALFGRRTGDTVEFEAPGGKREITIEGVRYEPLDPLPDDLFRVE